ncbi:MAG: hypothetical protein KDI46_07195 [Alphaproteobacteria bacterium]|nr:hypothetical protein [Alphaproteobacteria bacterium]
MSNKTHNPQPDLTRRRITAALALAPLAAIFGCSDNAPQKPQENPWATYEEDMKWISNAGEVFGRRAAEYCRARFALDLERYNCQNPDTPLLPSDRKYRPNVLGRLRLIHEQTQDLFVKLGDASTFRNIDTDPQRIKRIRAILKAFLDDTFAHQQMTIIGMPIADNALFDTQAVLYGQNFPSEPPVTLIDSKNTRSRMMDVLEKVYDDITSGQADKHAYQYFITAYPNHPYEKTNLPTTSEIITTRFENTPPPDYMAEAGLIAPGVPISACGENPAGLKVTAADTTPSPN